MSGGPWAMLGALLLAPVPCEALAQETPPPPLPMERFELPPFREAVLSNGARLVVVARHEVPFVTASVILPGGQSVEPAGREGLAELTAGLLAKGTASRSADEIEEAVDFLGAGLAASSNADWTSVTAEAVTSALPEMVGILADVVMHPSFAEDELELLRTRTLSRLNASMAQPGTLADRAFLRAIYGDHPYGRLPTAESLASLDRAAVVDFHRTWYRPDRALFLVAGDVDFDDARGFLEDAFSGWESLPPPEIGFPSPPPLPPSPRVVVVDQPGAVQAVVRMGHILVRGDHPEWTPLSMLNQVLGGGPSSRLFRVLREERGLTYAAYSQMQRHRDLGFFSAFSQGRTDVAGEIVEEMLAQVARARSESVGPQELKDAQDFLVGSFPLQLETPQQLADVLAMGRVFGLPDTALVTYRERVAALGPEDLREVASDYLHPDAFVIVLVGDAAALLPQLRAFPEVEVVDADGRPIDRASFLVRARSIPLDATRLEPTDVTYGVTYQGRSVGTLARTLRRGEEAGTMVYRGTADLGVQQVEQSVTFRMAGFEALAADARIDATGQVTTMEVELQGDRMTGRISAPAGTQGLDVALPEGAVVGDMAELVLWLADLSVGMQFTVPVVLVETGAVHNAPYRVTGLEEVSVPAGTFRGFRVEMGGPQPQTVWVREEAPHVLLRVEPAGQPVAIELTRIETGGG